MIYLDNNATTRIDSKVLEAMMPYLTDNFANAASTHIFGVGASEAVKLARQQVSDLIGSETHEIVFTSGATEAINLAIKGIAENYHSKGKHIITVSTEHSAVLDVCEYLATKGFEITYLQVGNDGLIDLEILKSTIRSDTIMVSVMMVNNETGIIQNIKDIADITHSVGAIFMSDGTQAVGKIPLNVKQLGIDLLTFSGHKIYGPKGIGALYVRQTGQNRLKLAALMHGGGHERGMRSGTLNVPGIIGLGKACELALKELNHNMTHVKYLRDLLESELLRIENSHINGSKQDRIYNVTNICFKGVDSDAVIMGLSNPESDIPIIAVSNGSACTSTKIEPSHVLLAMGLSEIEAYSSIRFSLGKFNKENEIIETVAAINDIVSMLKEMTF